MNYRFKTHDELLADGYVLTPGGTYLHSQFNEVKPGMAEYASQFNPELVKLMYDKCDRPWGQAMFIDEYVYCAQHFTEI